MKKKLRFFDILALAFSSVFSLELISSQAKLGPSLIFNFVFIGLTYFLCHGLICAELGAAYPDQGGIYVWVKKAYGDRWAARTTWWYWLNVAGFIPATAVVMVSILKEMFLPDLSVWGIVIICILCVWFIVLFNCIDLQKAKWLPIISSISKITVTLVLFIGSLYFIFKNGAVNNFSGRDLIPELNMSFVVLIPVYVYSVTGFDLISCSAGEMENPSKNVPKTVFLSGFFTIFFYILSATAILIVLPAGSISETSGLFDTIVAMFGSKFLVNLIGMVTFVGFLGYVFGWALGGNKVALEAGESGELPKIFAKTNQVYAPVGSAVLLGIVSTGLLIFYGITASTSENLFWTLLAFTSIIFFLPYLVMSFTFLKLRKIDPETERPFKVPFGKPAAYLVTIVHFAFLLFGSISFLLPPEGENPTLYVGSLVIGLLLSIGCGEVLIHQAIKQQKVSAIDA
ncbi:amino acid transporter [Enterococcus florum]|uniref:Amino acid transporter n=1 Tax=Enterococcus florum TaxID=2480627 RepID=A0A4P5PA12_9ENTE|nr:APC family permease [Enterococcus florum]GCF94945.1 amino acid transporter [Enterococcus florum]